MAAVRAEAQNDHGTVLKVKFRTFYEDYLKVGSAPDDRPYLLPFVLGKGGAQLFNKNVAGSYAPSSLRDVAPIRTVLKFDGAGSQVTHELVAQHEQLALKSLVSQQRVPVDSLSIFLFRDHKIERTDTIALECVVDKFCEVFGYDLSDKKSKSRFETLYVRDSETFDGIHCDSGA